LILNIVSILVVTFVSLIILNQVFNYNLLNIPDWAIKN